jgi:hypothetical protein
VRRPFQASAWESTRAIGVASTADPLRCADGDADAATDAAARPQGKAGATERVRAPADRPQALPAAVEPVAGSTRRVEWPVGQVQANKHLFKRCIDPQLRELDATTSRAIPRASCRAGSG